MITEFIDALAEALEKDPVNLKPEDKFRDYEEWDSLAVLSVIAMIKQGYGITIPRKEFDELVTVEELFSYIDKKK